ncbi:MAG: hypothetical protein ACRYHQ_14050, partial [Janthinobacterium lividum]
SALQRVLAFAVSPTATASYSIPYVGLVVALPPLDAANPALAILNSSSAPIAVLLGATAALPIIADGSRGTRIAPGATLLLSGDPGNLAATATYAAILPLGPGMATVTFTRGTTSPLTLFSAWNDL